jgi:hypothetical protein
MATVLSAATYIPLERTAGQIVGSLFDHKAYDPAPEGNSFKRV